MREGLYQPKQMLKGITLSDKITYQITVHIAKNGIDTVYVTPEFETNLSDLNEYTLNY